MFTDGSTVNRLLFMTPLFRELIDTSNWLIATNFHDQDLDYLKIICQRHFRTFVVKNIHISMALETS